MKIMVLSLLVGFFHLLSGASTASAAERTPFTDMLFDAAPSVQVQMNGETFYLLDLNGQKRATIMEKCEAAFGAQCPCMIAERFTQTMAKIGLPVGDTVSLRLYRLANHSIETIPAAPVTADNQDEMMINRASRNMLCYP